MICPNCGKQFPEGSEFSSSCGTRQEGMRQIPADKSAYLDPEAERRRETSRKLCIWSLIVGFGMTAALYGTDQLVMRLFHVKDLHFWINEVLFLFPVAGLVLMIIGRVKDPQSRFAKIVMWQYIAAAIVGAMLLMLAVILIFFLSMTCTGALPACR